MDGVGDSSGAHLLEAIQAAKNFLYFCDLGNLFIIVALLGPTCTLLFSWQAVSLLLSQTFFTIDLAGAFLSGHHFIGGTEFMFDPHLLSVCAPAEPVPRGDAAIAVVGALATGIRPSGFSDRRP